MGFTIDASRFLKGLSKAERAVDDELKARALFQAANELLRDAIKVRPQAPFDEGHLHGSSHVVPPEVTANRAEIRAGFNIVYAARWHELTPEEDSRINWTRTGVKFPGRKYLEMKMSMFKNKYAAIVAAVIKRRLDGGR